MDAQNDGDVQVQPKGGQGLPAMPSCLPREAVKLWEKFVRTAHKDGGTVGLALAAGMHTYLCWPDPKPGQEWDEADGDRVAALVRAAGVLSQAAVAAGDSAAVADPPQRRSGQDLSMPKQMPAEAQGIWAKFVADCKEDRIPLGLGLAAALDDWMTHGQIGYDKDAPESRFEWPDDDGKGSMLKKVAAQLYRVRCEWQAGSVEPPASSPPDDDYWAGIIAPISSVAPSECADRPELTTKRPAWWWLQGDAIWQEFVAQCRQDRVTPAFGLLAAVHFWTEHKALKDPSYWGGRGSDHGSAFLETAEILADGGVARERMRPCHTPGGSIEDVSPRPDDESVVLKLLPVVGKVLRDRFLATCKSDQLEPERAAAAAVWYWLDQESLSQGEDWDYGTDESLKARALRGLARLALDLVTGRVDDGQDTGETEEATPAES